MQRDKQLRSIIAPDGKCSVDAINFTGPSCQTATNEITAVSGGQIHTQHDKPEARLRERCGQSDREAAR